MTIEELFELTDEDLNIDKSSLDTESLRIPLLHNKYRKFLFSQALEVRKVKKEYDKLYIVKTDYYKGYCEKPYPKKVIGKDNLEKHLKADEELNKVIDRLVLEEEKYKFLEDVVKTLSNRNFTIKNAIDYMKMVNNEC